MENKLIIILINLLLLGATGYSQQDSVRTRNNKPGTPQSLRIVEQSPQSQAKPVNSNTAPGNTVNHAATGNTIVVDPNKDGQQVPTSGVNIQNGPPAQMDTSINNSAIQNGISNAPKAIRK